MNGLEATKQIKNLIKNNAYMNTKIVAYTSGVSEEEEAACYDVGMDGFLIKPST